MLALMWSAVAGGWDSITIGNIVTWGVMAGGWIAFWVKLKDRVDNNAEQFLRLEKQITQRLDNQDVVIASMRDTGSPISRQAIASLNARFDAQCARIIRLENDVNDIKLIKVDVEWMRREMQERKRR